MKIFDSYYRGREIRKDMDKLEEELDKLESKLNSLCTLLGVAFSNIGMYSAKAHFVVKDKESD